MYLSNLASQIDRDCGTEHIPLVIILDDISDASSITDLVNSALTCKYHKWCSLCGVLKHSFLVQTQLMRSDNNNRVHLLLKELRFVGSYDTYCVFSKCSGALKLNLCIDIFQVHGQKSAWEDPVEWVRDTLPWPSAQQDQAKLFHLPPPTTGPNSAPTQQPSDDRVTSNKDTSLSTMESDPLMAMLLKLQESANYIESPERDISGNPTF
ncbi:neuron navigator 1-like [Sinocyclocheilus anshuiensis]|uniref:neuron navigator 1-like n=1 Tax=Sinocyclocheilus anshuiensis TaxID=1608454 RepID=UPI0007B7AC53|nr:PREDICTED: neuron navigator 1-like [Sinocyclocheilus anshuiensis]